MDVRNITIVIMATLASKCMGFIREIIIGAYFGATSTTDAYLLAMTVPAVIFDSIIAAAVANVFIPVFCKSAQEEGNEASLIFTNSLICISTLICLLISVLGIVFAKQIVLILGIGFAGQTQALASGLLSISISMLAFINLTYIFSAFLQTHHNFAVPACIGLLNNAIIIAALLLVSNIGVYGLVIANVIGAVGQMLMVYIFAVRCGFKLKWEFNIQNHYLRDWFSLLGPAIIGSSVLQLSTLVDRILASGLAAGSIAALNFSYKLTGFVYGVFALSISTVIFPQLSSLNLSADSKRFQTVIISSLNSITILTIPVMVGIILLKGPIVAAVFERGAFTTQATQLTASALLYYSLGIVFYGYKDILNKIFYSMHDARTPMLNGSVALGINILLNLLLIGPMKHNGLALATSLSAFATTIMLFVSLTHRIGIEYLKPVLAVTFKCLAAAAFMAGFNILWQSLCQHPPASLLSICKYVLGSGIIYFSVLVLLQVKELTPVFWAIRNWLERITLR